MALSNVQRGKVRLSDLPEGTKSPRRTAHCKKDMRIAMHEAGHVICNLAFGHPFEFVELSRELRAADLFPQYDLVTGEFVGGRVHYSGDRNHLAYERVIVAMGGVAGERVNQLHVKHLTFINWMRGAEADERDAKEMIPSDAWSYLCFKARTPEDAIDAALQKAHYIVRRYRESHKAVASALLERRRLSYEECLKELNEGAPFVY